MVKLCLRSRAQKLQMTLGLQGHRGTIVRRTNLFFDEIGLNICKEHFRQLIPLEQHKLTAGTAT